MLVVVRALSDGALRAAGAATRSWMEAGNPAPLTLTSSEWRSSADIFAIEYADILAAHRVLHGTLSTDGIVVARRDLRLQLERETMGKLLQLRREMQARLGDAKAQREHRQRVVDPVPYPLNPQAGLLQVRERAIEDGERAEQQAGAEAEQH